MKRVLAALLVLCGTSGCYTVLRHPAVERTASVTFYDEAPYALGPMQDCAACHETWAAGGFDPWLPPYPPVWLAYNTGPWWQRQGIAQAQGQGLVNARPRPPADAAMPVAIGVPPNHGLPAVKPAPPGLGSTPASSPHPAADPGPPVVHTGTGGRDSGGASAPHSAPDRPAPAPAAQAAEPSAAAATRAAVPAPAAASPAPVPVHGAGMANSRPRPS